MADMLSSGNSSAVSLMLEPSVIKAKFNITEDELKCLRKFGENYQNEIAPFLDDFYKWMRELPEFPKFFDNSTLVERVKEQQSNYWKEFFDASITQTYLRNRVHIGVVHARIGLPIHSYCAGMNFSAEWWKNKIEEFRYSKGDNKAISEQASSVAKVFNKLIQLDIMIVTETYHKQSQEKLEHTLKETNTIVKNLTKVAEDVLSGNYKTKLSEDEDGSGLNKAMNQMISELRRSSDETKRDKWLKEGQAELANQLRGDQDLSELCANGISFMANYLHAKVGAFYLIKNNDELHLMGSYAFQVRKSNANKVKVGEGLLGQVVLERKPMVIQDVPENYLTVGSGLGSATPANVLLAPIIFEGEVKAVLELGSFEPFTELHLKWVELVSESVAVAINSGLSREKMKELLADSEEKSKALEEQQTKLESSNKELEEKAEILRKSQEELRAQGEELKAQSEEMLATNEELEEKTKALEEQKKNIEKKNSELESSRKDLEKKAAELQSSGKYKSEFLSNMSHELRTPLNSLLILAQSLSENDEGNLTTEQVEEANVIYNSGKDLLCLINDILDLSKVEAGKLKVEVSQVELNPLLDSLQAIIRPLANKRKIGFEIKVEDGVEQTFNSDSMRVEQVLKNLLSNAIKFTDENGTVKIVVSHPSDAMTLKDIKYSANDILAFAVVDDGIGISQQDQESVFSAFQQVDGSIKRQRGGTGLGLAISRQLSEVLGGFISLESEEGKGSTFTLFLPKAGPSDLEVVEKNIIKPSKEKIAMQEQISTACETAKQGDEILIIEDDESFAKILERVIRRKKLKALFASTAEEGMRLAVNNNPIAIILDKGLPDMDGLVLLEKLKADKATANIPVHMVTGSDVKEEAEEKGAEGFLQKPIDKKTLDNLISGAAKKIEEPVRELLIVEDDMAQCKLIQKSINDENINITVANSAEDAYEMLLEQRYHCMILDLNLPGMNGKDLLEKMSQSDGIALPAIIIYTASDISFEEQKVLAQYAPSIVLKTADAPQRLIDEVGLFLNKIEHDEPKKEIYSGGDEDLTGRKVLLVDDDMRNNIALGSYLRKRGLTVVTADNGELAIDCLEGDESIDLVLMDIMMPVMDGYTAMKKIRDKDNHKDVPIIALTAKAMVEDRNKCLEAGANDYLSKPIDTNKLFNLMKVWLNKE